MEGSSGGRLEGSSAGDARHFLHALSEAAFPTGTDGHAEV